MQSTTRFGIAAGVLVVSLALTAGKQFAENARLAARVATLEKENETLRTSVAVHKAYIRYFAPRKP